MNRPEFNPYHDESMFKGAPPESFEKAKALRSKLTNAEKKIWEMLNADIFKQYKFRRQHPIHIYIVDFYSHHLKLVIEVDGEYHNQEEQIQKDNQRTGILEFQDLNVIRFSNEEVINELPQVKIATLDYIQSLTQKSRNIFPVPKGSCFGIF